MGSMLGLPACCPTCRRRPSLFFAFQNKKRAEETDGFISSHASPSWSSLHASPRLHPRPHVRHSSHGPTSTASAAASRSLSLRKSCRTFSARCSCPTSTDSIRCSRRRGWTTSTCWWAPRTTSWCGGTRTAATTARSPLWAPARLQNYLIVVSIMWT